MKYEDLGSNDYLREKNLKFLLEYFSKKDGEVLNFDLEEPKKDWYDKYIAPISGMPPGDSKEANKIREDHDIDFMKDFRLLAFSLMEKYPRDMEIPMEGGTAWDE